MPIDTVCPHCGKKYRLKDELAGRRATCSNQECRQQFNVPKPKVEDRSLIEAEALAASLFGEDPVAVAVAEQQVEVICAMCDFKWNEPTSKVGKNVICPDCKHRQKIPERKVKKADWRDPNADKPGGARGPELPEDLKAQQTTQVQFESLKDAGAVEDDREPISLVSRLKWILPLAALVLAIGLGIFLYMQSRKEGKENQYMAEAVKELPEYKDDGPMAKGQPALCRALLLMSAGEHSARSDSKEKLKEAIGQFGSARDELLKAPKSAERDLLVGELAIAILSLGGDEGQVGREVKIRWSQQDHQALQTRIGAELGYVQIELRRVLTLLKNETRADDLDLRLSIVRRLARELTKLGRTDLLHEILQQAFHDGEYPEAKAQVALESLLAGATPDKVQPSAEELKSAIALGGNFNPTPISAQVLWQKLGTPGVPTLVGAPGSGELSRPARLAAVGASLSQKNAAEALALATRPGQLDDRVLALAMIAEQSAEPMAAVDATLEIDPKLFTKTTPQYAILRIAIAAAKAKQMDKAEKIWGLLGDDGLKAWAKADCQRWYLAANPTQKAEVATADRPDDSAKLRVSAAFGALTVARHNAAENGVGNSAKEYETWGKGNLRAFGLAGLALGLQDSKR